MQIYVGNLAFTATVDDVRQLFEPYGDVARVHLPEDRRQGARVALVSSRCPTRRKLAPRSPGCMRRTWEDDP